MTAPTLGPPHSSRTLTPAPGSTVDRWRAWDWEGEVYEVRTVRVTMRGAEVVHVAVSGDKPWLCDLFSVIWDGSHPSHRSRGLDRMPAWSAAAVAGVVGEGKAA